MAMAVQLYGVDTKFSINPDIEWFTAYLILPDGSHALALCGQHLGGPPCLIKAFIAEKRVKVPCDLLKGDTTGLSRECYQSESYWAGRNGNDITLSTINGRVMYTFSDHGEWPGAPSFFAYFAKRVDAGDHRRTFRDESRFASHAKSQAGRDRGIPPFTRRRVGHPASFYRLRFGKSLLRGFDR